MKKVCIMCLREFEVENPPAGMWSCDSLDCAGIYERREAERRAEGERRRRANFSRGGNQSYGHVPWARK